MSLLKALAAVSGMTIISRVLGFVRDLVIARVFGAGLFTDAFFVAFKIPNLMRRLFAEGAFSQAFVPILGEYKNRHGEPATRLLVDHVAAALAGALFVVSPFAAGPLRAWNGVGILLMYHATAREMPSPSSRPIRIPTSSEPPPPLRLSQIGRAHV